MKLPSISFIGFGKMAEGIYKGLLKSGTLGEVSFVEYSDTRRKEVSDSFGLKAIPLEEASSASIVLSCIKPQQIKAVLEPLKGLPQKGMWISILAGVPIATYEQTLKTKLSCIRVMPNLAVTIGEGMSALACNQYVTDKQKQIALEIFSSVGKALVVPEEWLDIVTGISGSGPAFCYHFAKAIVAAGNKMGMDEKTALTLIAQTMIGAGKMLLTSQKSPQELAKDVTSPGGTTAAGLHLLETLPIEEDIQKVVLAAINRSIELGKESI